MKDIDKNYLESDYGEPDYDDLRILAIDEISLSRGHECMTAVADHVRDRVIWMG